MFEMDARRGETHLVLFFDVNGTIIANDSAKNKAREVALLQILAEKFSAVWDAAISTDVMSYRQFLAKFHVTTPTKQEADLQLQNGYNGFINFLRDTNHDLFNEVSATYAKMNAELSRGDLFPSFIKMIRDLKAQKKLFSIILRSFGNDSENVVKEIEDKTNIKFTYNAKFNAGSLRAEKKVLVHPRFILADILPGVHGVWADNYKYWHDHGELHTHGKLYPIDLENDKMLTIFFDDNALDKQILCMRPTTRELDNDEQIAYQAKMMVMWWRLIPCKLF
jgi:hypothetical protein